MESRSLPCCKSTPKVTMSLTIVWKLNIMLQIIAWHSRHLVTTLTGSRVRKQFRQNVTKHEMMKFCQDLYLCHLFVGAACCDNSRVCYNPSQPTWSYNIIWLTSWLVVSSNPKIKFLHNYFRVYLWNFLATIMVTCSRYQLTTNSKQVVYNHLATKYESNQLGVWKLPDVGWWSFFKS